jgi:two-component system response regulator YesN
MRGIAQSHQEALEALKYRLIPGGGQILYLNDMRLSEVPKIIFPADKAGVMSGYLKSGDSANAAAVFREIVDPLAADAGVQNYQLQSLFIRLIGVVVDSMQELGIEWSLIFPELRSPFEILMSMDHKESLIDWCATVIQRVAEYTQTSRESRINGHVERVKRMVEKELDLKVNQTIVAERLGLNPFYLGRIFKEHTGMSFLDYLTETRTERAKRMLKETNLAVSEIASKIGYGDERYFIRVFKSKTGTTPGKYRNLRIQRPEA